MCSEISITQTSLLTHAACQLGCTFGNWQIRGGSCSEVQGGLQDHEGQGNTPDSSVLPPTSLVVTREISGYDGTVYFVKISPLLHIKTLTLDLTWNPKDVPEFLFP